MRLNHQEIKATLSGVLSKLGFASADVEIISEIFTSSTLDGYHSHGINRFGEFVKNVKKGIIDPNGRPVLTEKLGPISRFDGHQGAGPLNAYLCMKHAIQQAKDQVLSCVALNNTNHWMRGGSYGWQAADSGCIAICFTNTMPNMPPWGGTTVSTGNNPLIIAVPKDDGHIVLDMSMSQFSYGKMYEHRLKGEKLPFPGGFDVDGNMTTDPDKIIQSRRILQTGYWKGSGLSIMLDLLASLLANGNSTSDIGKLEAETGLSQVFICIDTAALAPEDVLIHHINEVVDHFKSSLPQQDDHPVRYPGEATIERRNTQLKNGIEISDEIWQQILLL